MDRGRIMDKRCPLAEGTKIFDQTNKRTYCILENKGQGALCLAYRAFYTDNLDKKHSVILKELYPVNLGISRTTDSVSLDIPANQIHTYSNLQKHFLQAYETQNSFHEQDTLMNATSDSRDIFFANNTHYAVIGIDAGDTYDRYADTTCRELFEITRSVARAVFEYHKAGYLHLDIKPDNFFVLKGTTSVKLIDFDSIHKIEEVHKLLFPISYSIGYAAPEVLECRESFENALKINVQSDVYSIGAMIFNRLFGRFPDIDDQYPGRDTRWEQWIHQCKLLDKASPKLQWELKQLFHKTLRYHPEDRCDTAQLITQLDLLVKLASKDSYYLSDQDIHVTTSKAHYISRLQTLNRIQEMLLRPDSHLVFLSGIGGSGKTETAREYAEMYRHQYHTIQFANYSGSLKNTIISLNYQNYQDFEDQEPDKKYEDKISELGEHDGHTLLIIDNFDEDLVIDEKRDDEVTVSIKRSNADVLDKLASLRNAESGDGIHILITTRNQPATGSYIKDFLPLENLSEPELTQLFFSINPHDAENRERHQLVHDLLQITSCHTMTVSLVASLSKEAEDYGEPGLEAICALLKKEGLSHLNGEVSYEKDRVSKNAEAFIHLKTLFRFNKMSDEEKYVLSNMVLVPVTGMRKKEFCSWVLSDTVKSVRIPVEKLIRTGWIIETNEPDISIHLHPLISEVVLDELKPDEEACATFLQNLEQKMKETAQDYSAAKPYIPVALHTGEFLYRKDSLSAMDKLDGIASFFEIAALYSDQLRFQTKILCVRESFLPPDYPALATSYNNIGVLYGRIGDYNKELEFHLKALSICKNSSRTDYSRLIVSYIDVSRSYGNLGNFKSELDFSKKAFCIYEKSELSDYNQLVAIYRRSAAAYIDLGDYNNALNFYKKALEIQKNNLKEEKLALADLYQNISSTYFCLGKYKEAITYIENALDLQLKLLPYDHPTIASSYGNLGIAHFTLGQYNKAIDTYLRQIKIYEKMSSFHPKLAVPYDNIGITFLELGDNMRALNYHKAALKIRERSLPHIHPDFAKSYNYIGVVYGKQGHYDEALTSLLKALSIFENVIASNHFDLASLYNFDLASLYNNVGLCYFKLGNTPDAVLFLKKSLSIRKEKLSLNHPDLIQSYINLGVAFKSCGELLKSSECYSEAMKIFRTSIDEGFLAAPRGKSLLKVLKRGIKSTEQEISKQLVPLDYKLKSLKICRNLFKDKNFAKNLLKVHLDQNYDGANKKDTLISDGLGLGLHCLLMADYLPKQVLGGDFSHFSGELFDNKFSTKIAKIQELVNSEQKIIKLSFRLAGTEIIKNLFHLFSTKEFFCMPVHTKSEITVALNHELQALKIQKSVLPEDHLEIAATCQNISMAYWILKEYEKSLKFALESSGIYELFSHETRETLLASYCHISLLYHELHNIQKVKEYNEKILTVQKASMLKNNIILSTAYYNMSYICRSEHNFKESIYIMKSLFAILKQINHENRSMNEDFS